jgi:hypothetical protein
MDMPSLREVLDIKGDVQNADFLYRTKIMNGRGSADDIDFDIQHPPGCISTLMSLL